MSSDLCKPLVTASAPPKPPEKKDFLAPPEIEGRDLVTKNFRIMSLDVIQFVGLSGRTISADSTRTKNFEYYHYNFQKDLRLEKKRKTLNLTGDKSVVRVPGARAKGASKELPQEHTYINFTMPAPFDARDVEKNQVITRPRKRSSAFSTESNYNIYFKEYEDKVNSSKIEENAIPNAHMYSFLVESLFDKDQRNEDEEYKKELSYGKDPETLKKAITTKSNFNFNNYLQKYYSKISISDISSSSKAYKKYFVSQDDIVEYNDITETSKNTVNYSIYIEFPFDLPKALGTSETNFKEVFKKTNTDLNLLNFVEKTDTMASEGKRFQKPIMPTLTKQELAKQEAKAELIDQVAGPLTPGEASFLTAYVPPVYDPSAKALEILNEMFPRSIEYFTEKLYFYKSQLPTGPGTSVDIEALSPQGAKIDKLQTWDLTNFFTNFSQMTGPDLYNNFNPKSPYTLSSPKIFLGETNEALQKYQNNATYEFFQKLMNSAAASKFKLLLERHKAKDVSKYFDELHETPHEVLFYAIEKFGPNGQFGTYFLANPVEESKFERGVVKFLDTQIKYGVEYTYKVSAFCMVLGKKYKYIVDALGALVSIKTYDYIPLIRVPLFTTSGKVMDHPPVPPRVTFHPLKGKNNEIKIRLISENTEYWQVPQPITLKDEKEFKELIDLHGLDDKGRLLFTTDDFSKAFEIFRTDVKPRNYQDFDGKKIKTHILDPKYVSVTHSDMIMPNKKYYYTFRSIDAHNHISNPTSVYEVILRDDAGFIFPEIRIVDFLEGDYYKFSSEMQTYIQINPSAQNVFFDPDIFIGKESAKELNLDEGKEPPIGTATNAVWGKNFKMRITSKSSGKKVDVNFTFNKKHKKQ